MNFLPWYPWRYSGFMDTVTVADYSLLSFKLLTIFRTVRLFETLRNIRGSEIFIMTIITRVNDTILGDFWRIYCRIFPNPNATITNINDAFWWAIETITTVAYGEFYPVTFFGKAIATVVMFATIGILWTLVALVTSTIIDKKIKKAQVGLVDEAKTVIKNRIDEG